MKNKLAILLALLMSLNTAAAVYAEDGTGGTVPSEEGIVTEEIPDDATGGRADDPATDGETTVTVANEAALREVIENPLTANTTVILDTDITGVSGRFQIPDSGEYRLTLDMNGHTISAAETLEDDMIVNLGDLVVTGNGTFEVTGNAFATIANERKLEIVNGTFINTSQRSGVGAVYSNADLTIHGGEFTGAFFAVVCDGGRVTIGGGLITGTNNGQPALEVRRGAKVTIKGGTISSPHGAIGVADGESTVVINDGTCRSTNDRYVFVGNLEAFTLNGGSYEGNGADYGYLRDRLGQFVGEGKTVTIMGQTYTAPVIPKDGISEGTVEVTTAEGLAAALAQPLTGEKTVVLKANIEGISGKIKVPNSGDNLLVLDMGDYSISAADDYGNIVIENYGKMVIEGGSYSFNAANASRIILNKNLIDIYDGEFNASEKSGATAVYNAGAELHIVGGKFRGFYAVMCDGGYTDFVNGTFIGTNAGQPAVDINGGARVDIRDGVFTSNHAAIGIADSGSRVTIYNGKFEGTGKSMIMCGNLNRLTIHGGTYSVPNTSYGNVLNQIERYITEGSTVTINGKSYTVEPIPEGELLTGTAFGTKYWGEDDPDRPADQAFPSYDKAFDNDPLTYYDAYGSTLDAHVGMKFDSPTRLTKVEIIPRNNGFDAERIFLDASDGFNNEGGDRLFDGSKNSKWCSPFHKEDENSVNFVSWQTDRPVSVVGYEIYTANDTAHFGDRNPISWSLWGSPDGQEWYIIDRQTNNYDIPEENYACYTVNCPVEVLDENGNPVLNEDGIAETQPHQGYSYFELYIDDVPGDTFQLSEFRLLEAGNEWVRMDGMTVQGSNDGVYWKDLCTFADLDVFYAQPYTWKASRGKFVNDYSFTQFRVVNKEQHLNVAEVKFYGVPNSDLPAYDAKLPEGEHNLLDRGYIFGSEPWDNNSNAGKAFDRNTDTWFDAAGGSGINAEIGIELETPAQLTGFKVHPRESDVNRLMNLTVQGSVNGNDWITLYQFDDVQDYDYRWYEISDDMFASAAQEYAFTQFRVINKSEHLNVAEVEFIGTYEHDLESFPTEIHEPIYSYITADQFMNTAWAYYERDPENPDDDHHLDWWYFDERDEEGMTRFEREFEGLEPIILIGGVGFNDTVMDIQDIDGKPIVAVAPWAFAHEDDISKVIVNEDSDCRYILNNAFAECHNIEFVTVSNSLRHIEGEAFRHNWSLREFIKADGDLTHEELNERDWARVEVIDDALIANDRLICYPSAIAYRDFYRVPDSVYAIDNRAFDGSPIGEITMGHNVTEIGHGAFDCSTAHTIRLSPALRYLANDVFYGCRNLTLVEIPSDKVELDRWMDEDTNLTDGDFMFTPDMFGWTVDEDTGRTEPLKVVSYEGGMIDEYIDYIHALTDAREDYDMSHVVFEAETDTYWYGGNWFEECGENEVFLLGYSAPLDAEITTMPTETYDGKTIIGIRTDGDAWPAFRNDNRVCGGDDKTFVIPEGIKYIYNVPFNYCDNIETFVIPASLENIHAPFLSCHGLKNFVVTEGGTFYTDEDGAVLYYTDIDNGEVLLAAAATNCGKTEIEVLEGTGCIMQAAFEGNLWLERVILPESLYAIDWWAFGDTLLKSITIPENVDRIMPYAFAECPNLTEVRIERMIGDFCDPRWEQDFRNVFENSPNVTVYVYEGTDAHRAAEEYGWNYETVELDTTVYDTYVDNDGVHLSKAIAKPGDTYFTIPDDVQIIDDRAFAGIEGIETVVFPANLRYIGHEAFAGCGEFEVIFEGAVPLSYEDSSFDDDNHEDGIWFQEIYDEFHYNRHIFHDGILYRLTGETQEPREAIVVGYWYNAIKDGVITVPETIEGYEGTHTVVALANDAFHRDNGTNEARWFVEEVCGETLPEGWDYPTEIYLPDSIRYIGDAFGWQTEEMNTGNEYGLTRIDLPASVQFISHDFVTGCWCIESYTGLDDWNDENSGNPYRLAYGQNENGEAIGVIVNTWNEPMLHAYPQGNPATEFIMPAGIEVIQHNAFRDAQHLTHVNLTEGNSLRSIRGGAFLNCQNLERVMIPHSLENIDGGAFRECHSLVAFDIPNGNDTFTMREDDGTLRMDGGSTIAVVLFGHIGEDGVYRVSDDVYDIRDAAAQGFYALEELIIPASVHNIYDWAFEDAMNLRKVTIEGMLDYFSIDAFAWARNLETIEYHGEYLDMHYYRDDNIDDLYVRVQLDENGNDVRDENGRNIREQFEFVTTESDCHINFFLVDDYDYENGHREYLDVDNNEYFTLVRGGTVDPEPDEPGEPDVPVEPDEPAVPDDAVKIIVGNGYGAAGTTVTVDISIDDIPEPGISSLDLSVDYDQDLLRLVSANDTGLLGGALYSNDLSMIPYGLTWNNLENYTVSGVITTLTFEVLEMPDSGEIEVTVINNECATIEEEQVDVVVTNGIISKRLPGDVNEDGKVSQLDVTRLRKYLAGGWDVEINASNADVNGDGKISQLDVTRLRKYLVGGWNVTLE